MVVILVASALALIALWRFGKQISENSNLLLAPMRFVKKNTKIIIWKVLDLPRMIFNSVFAFLRFINHKMVNMAKIPIFLFRKLSKKDRLVLESEKTKIVYEYIDVIVQKEFPADEAERLRQEISHVLGYMETLQNMKNEMFNQIMEIQEMVKSLPSIESVLELKKITQSIKIASNKLRGIFDEEIITKTNSLCDNITQTKLITATKTKKAPNAFSIRTPILVDKIKVEYKLHHSSSDRFYIDTFLKNTLVKRYGPFVNMDYQAHDCILEPPCILDEFIISSDAEIDPKVAIRVNK